MKQTLPRMLAVLLLLAGLHVIHYAADVAARRDLWIALAAAESNEDLQPLITTTELVVGENRFAFGLMKANRLLERADVQLRFVRLMGRNLA